MGGLTKSPISSANIWYNTLARHCGLCGEYMFMTCSEHFTGPYKKYLHMNTHVYTLRVYIYINIHIKIAIYMYTYIQT